MCISNEECGERQLFVATSARYPPKGKDGSRVAGAASEGEVDVGNGVDGVVGSGVYCVEWDGESVSKKSEEVLASLRKDGTAAKVWEDTEMVFKRITGTVTIPEDVAQSSIG